MSVNFYPMRKPSADTFFQEVAFGVPNDFPFRRNTVSSRNLFGELWFKISVMPVTISYSIIRTTEIEST